ncbi:hypothetical protein HK098_004821 [Nowakowskiella sp. JEL0407]|nr:hypothetical protein HK098_004821 [Nowakowskiella sp. JEL0407]
MVVSIRIMFSTIPGLTTEAAWTLTNLVYNLGTFFMFHWLIGTPFELNQGKFENLTLWEQIDNGAEFTPTKKFLTAVPIVLFLISLHYTHYDLTTFTINFIPLMVNLIAKLPAVHSFNMNSDKMESEKEE